MASSLRRLSSAGLGLATACFSIDAVAQAAPATGTAPSAAPVTATPTAPPATAAASPPELSTGAARPAERAALSTERGAAPPASPRAEVVDVEEGSHVAEPATLDDGSFGAFQRHSFISAGFRSSLVKSDGFDPFASSDVLTYVAFGAGRTLVVDGPLSVVLGIGLDIAERGATARGADTSLSVVRFGLVPELRYHLFKRGFLFGRLGLGVARVSSSLEDPVTDRDWESKHTTFTGDLGGGFAYAIASSRSMRVKSPRLWLFAEGGALYVPTLDQKLSNSQTVPARSTDLVLPELALLSPYLRLGAMLSF